MSLTIAAMLAYNEEHSIAIIVLGYRKYVDRVIADDGRIDPTAKNAAGADKMVIIDYMETYESKNICYTSYQK
jgi:hypothetical protein